MRLLSAVLLLVALLAGCGAPASHEPGAGPNGVPLPEFPVMDVVTTAIEPFEYRGFIRTAWGDGYFAIESETEPDLAHFTVVSAGRAYTSQAGQAWVDYDLDSALQRGVLSNRLALWDLRALLSDPSLSIDVGEEEGTTVWHAKGTVQTASGPAVVDLTVRAVDGKVTGASLDAPKVRESPFIFEARGSSFLQAPQVPAAELTRPPSEVLELDTKADEGHRRILAWIDNYRNARGGLLPERVDPEAFGLEMFATGGEWPTNPYTGQPMANSAGSGDFSWTRCTLSDGVYQGHGWDGLIRVQTFGQNPCRPS